MMNLEERVKELEASNRRWKMMLTSLVIVLAVLVCVGGQAESDRIIQAKEFRVVDDRGKVLASLGIAPEGGAHVAFQDLQGKPRARFGTFLEDESVWSGLQIAGPKGSPIVNLGAEDSGASLWLHDLEGQRRIALDVRAETSTLKIADKEGKTVFTAP